ncbi:hypothetical protein GCM10007977_041310 [Dactylosporangium sucinum]|uniref:SsuA/THI5-like domain-containing protein n=2 Tax=Dactylosporangium sucinum TaxID=1424081 RepID=A0A917TS76_9ACTN|nr:hypothetical protein GCM10007977_041310 [Dactylosporangium sucinum]
MSRRAAVAGLLAAGVALFSTGCGEDSGPRASDGQLTKVAVGVQPTAPFSVVPLGVEQGIFKKYGLDVEIKIISTASTMPPAVLADQLQFSNWSFPSFAALADKKLPLKIIGAGDTAGRGEADDYIQLISLADGGVTSVSQLAGKKVAVNSLASLTEVQIKAALKAAGVDPASVELVPIPFPDQFAALAAKRVDAIGAGEPFLTAAKQKAKVNFLSALDAAVMPDLPLSLWMTSERFLQQNPKAVRAFQLALKESLEYAKSNPDKVRAFMPGFAKVDEAVAKAMILPNWTSEVDMVKVQQIVTIMHEYGVVPSAPDLSPYMTQFPLPE